jgi:hypothetical protein
MLPGRGGGRGVCRNVDSHSWLPKPPNMSLSGKREALARIHGRYQRAPRTAASRSRTSPFADGKRLGSTFSVRVVEGRGGSTSRMIRRISSRPACRRLIRMTAVALSAVRKGSRRGRRCRCVCQRRARRIRLPKTAIYDVAADIRGLAHGASFTLFVRDGVLSLLEGVTATGDWPEDTHDFRVYRFEAA